MPTKTWRWGGEEVVGGSGGLGKRVGWVMGSLWLTEATGCSEEHHKITLVFNFFFFATGPHRAALAGLELPILWPQAPLLRAGVTGKATVPRSQLKEGRE
jgi:hypothetical protein